MLDAAIIGTGPAGLSAAMNLKLHNKEFVWFGSSAFSIKVEKSECIANYPGLGPVTGGEMNQKLHDHAAQMGIAVTDQMVTSIMAGKDRYMLLGGNEIYESRTVLLAIGSVNAKCLPGEQELLGHGVSYCATCDGFLYKGKTIAVYCGSERYVHEAAYLADMAGKVWLYTPYSDCGLHLPNVEPLSAPMAAIHGDKHVSGIVLADQSEVAVQAVFILRDAVAPATLLKGLAMDGAHITVNRSQETNLPGCFAAGDCTGRPYQIAKAVGEGNVAAHSMVEYLARLQQ